MLENIQLSYPSYFLIFCAVAAIIYAVSLYWRSSAIKSAGKNLPLGLGMLRFLSIGLITFMLLIPFLKHLVETQQDPIILIAEDRSQSITATMDEAAINNLNSEINNLEATLSEKFTVKRFGFGEKIYTEVIDSFVDQSTNLSSQLEYFENQYSDQNIGAIVLVTDGIFNEGINPIYHNSKFKAPIHTVALGDTTIRRDLFIKNILNNRVAYLGDAFNLQVDVQAFNAAGSSSKITVSKISGGKTTEVSSQNFNISSNNYFKTFDFNIDAADVGNVRYRISLNGISDELSRSNNSRDTYIEVLDARQKILLLANAPHPDLAAFKTLIENNKNYEVEIGLAKNPVDALKKYDLVMLHNLPSPKHAISAELNTLKTQRIPTIFVTGNQTDLARFNAAQETMSIAGQVASSNEIQALWNSSFNGYKIDQRLKGQLEKFNPLAAPFGEYNASATAEVLLYQKIGKVDTKYPLLAYGEKGNWKTTIFTAEGIWKWKLFEHMKYKSNDLLHEFMNKMIQYSSKKDDKRKFIAFVSKNVFKENEEIIFDAQLFNDNYELINEPEVALQVKDGAGNNFDYIFSKTNNYYTLNAGALNEGNYNFTASSNYNGQQYSSSGNFSIQSIQKEQYDLTARHSMLSSLSEKYGGGLYYPNQVNKLGTDILASTNIKPILYQSNKTESLLNMKWLFIAIALMLLFEWFLRRFYGSY